MKIGILTFHRAENFGAALQVYALCEYLNSLGHSAEVIDYRTRAIEQNYDIFNPSILFSRKNILHTLRLYFKRISNYKSLYKKKKLFCEFRKKYLKLTPSLKSIDSDLGFDAYIAGSDQIWRLSITGGLDNCYFLNFPTKNNAKKIVYAASSELSDYTSLYNCKEKLSKLLSNIHSISVREIELKEEISKYTGKEISTCVDPTFLLSSNYYRKLATLPKVSGYILVYHLSTSEHAYRLARKISIETGKTIIEIFAGDIIKFDSSTHERLNAFGPTELLGYIINADTVITTSFHGLALSTIFRKNFWVVKNSSNIRLRNLLRSVGLESRLLENADKYKGEVAINYQDVETKNAMLIQASKDFLNKALS